MGSHSYLVNLADSCNNNGSGNITINGTNRGEIINGSSNGCTGGNYRNTSSSSSDSKAGGGRTSQPRRQTRQRRNRLQNLVTFTGALTNEPSPVAPVASINGFPASDLNGVIMERPVVTYII